MATQPAQKAVAPPRMTLGSIVKGRLNKPLRVLVFGVEGIGKSTFGARAPEPVFLGTEDGTSELDVARFPEPKNWADVIEAIDTLAKTEHEYRSLVIDTLDWLEPLCWEKVCAANNETSIESFGYGKGYTAALDEWRVLLAALERLRAERKMHVIALAHSWVKTFKNPEGEDFDRYELKLHQRAGGLWKEWVDVVGFANYETLTHEDKRKRVRGIATGNRLLHTVRSAAWDAKNRYDLPDAMPLDWDTFAQHVAEHRPADPKVVSARINELLEGVAPDLKDKVRSAVAKAPTDAAHLARVLNHLESMISTQGASAS